MPVDAELVCKAVQTLLRTSLAAYIAQIEAEWTDTQTLPSWLVPADPLELPAIQPSDISIGRVDVVSTESNFPAIFVWVERETPIEGDRGEQNFAGENMLLFVRVIVKGLTVEETTKLVYRYTDAVRRCLMSDRTLKTAGLDLEVPTILFASSPDDPLYKAAQIESVVKVLVAW
jgi:hypothetical protein